MTNLDLPYSGQRLWHSFQCSNIQPDTRIFLTLLPSTNTSRLFLLSYLFPFTFLPYLYLLPLIISSLSLSLSLLSKFIRHCFFSNFILSLLPKCPIFCILPYCILFKVHPNELYCFKSLSSVMSDSLWPHGLQRARLPCHITNSQSLLKLMPIEWMMPSNHLFLCHPLLLPSIFPSIRIFSKVSGLCIRWPKYQRFSFSIMD